MASTMKSGKDDEPVLKKTKLIKDGPDVSDQVEGVIFFFFKLID